MLQAIAIVFWAGIAGAEPASGKGIKVNDVIIDRETIDRRLWKQYGEAVTQQEVDAELLRQEAKSQGIKGDPKEANYRLAQVKKQVGTEFESRLKATGLTPEAVLDQLKEGLVLEHLLKKTREIDVSDKELKDTFESHKTSMATPEKIRLRHILAETQAQAQEALASLKSGADFAKLAAAKSKDKATSQHGGELGLLPRGMIMPELDSAAFSLKGDEYSPIVKTQLGFHILQVTERTKSKPAVFKEIKDGLRASLLQQKIARVLPGYLQELRAKAKIEPIP